MGKFQNHSQTGSGEAVGCSFHVCFPLYRKLMNIAFSDMNPFPMKLLQNRRSAHRLKLEAELKELDRIKAQYVKEHSEQAAAGHLGGAVSEEEEET